jgi:hypothetical protein
VPVVEVVLVGVSVVAVVVVIVVVVVVGVPTPEPQLGWQGSGGGTVVVVGLCAVRVGVVGVLGAGVVLAGWVVGAQFGWHRSGVDAVDGVKTVGA